MVLILTTEAAEGERKENPKATPYRLVSHRKHLALVHKADVEPPTDEAIEDAARVFVEDSRVPSFFVTPYDMLLDNTGEAPSLETLFDDIGNCVSRRENVTVVNRGALSDQYLERLLLALVEEIRSPAEYAMQLVADEIAKEKQMQRLLQLENEAMDPSKEGVKHVEDAETRPEIKESGLPLSKKLRDRLKDLRKEYPYGRPADQHLSGRYTLLTAAHNADLIPPCQGGSALVPNEFTVNPPAIRKKGAGAASPREKNTRSNSFIYAQQKRKSALTILSELQEKTMSAECVPLKSNGWGNKMSFYTFDGSSSILALPGVPKFEDLVKSFSIDFWMRTDCKAAEGKRVILQIMEGQRDDLGQLFQVSLNWYEEMEDSLRIFVRDSTNRVLEALVPLKDTNVTSGESFHHIMLHVRSLDEGQIDCLVDGKSISIQLVQQEHPIAFNPWPHRLFIGGYLDESNSPVSIFRGSIVMLRVWSDVDTFTPVLLWPLLVGDSDKLVELTKTIPADHHETLLNLHVVEESAPPSSPHFDGNLVMNMGAMPIWGELMHNWRVEVKFRTDVSTRMMTLVGCTDQKVKMQEFGIVLNAEPVFSKERFRFHELNTTFYLVDAFGACCSALLRGTDRQNLMDGEWHTLVWKCIDSESNKFTVKVDNVHQDLLFVTREGPNRFVPFEDWVCVGGHNVRNWKIKRPFIGQIGRFYVSLRGHPYATLEMNEGPGSYVLQDRSGHENHGLLISPETNAVRKHDIIWWPVAKDRSQDDEDAPKQDVTIFRSHNVRIAATVFTCAFDSYGTPRETIVDIFKGTTHTPAVIEHDEIMGSRKELWKTWYAIPAECYRSLDTVTQLEEAINSVLSCKKPHGHLLIAIQIGDCLISFLHLQDPELPPEAIYNCNMLKWHYPFTVEGNYGRTELMLNRMIEGVEAVLLRDTLKPYVTYRLGPINAAHGSIIPEEVAQWLQDGGRPWFLPAILHTHLLYAEFGSSLHLLHRMYPALTFDEAASICLFNKRMCSFAQEKAAIVIQRNWRMFLGKEEGYRLEEEKQIRDRKVEEICTFRMNPAVQSKQKLYALLITLHDIACEGIPDLTEEVMELSTSLQKQGYEVDVLRNPGTMQLMKAISQVDTDTSSFIYISGYGGQITLRQPFLFGMQSLHLSLQEGAARAAVELDQGNTYRALIEQFKEEKLGVKSKKKKKKGANNAAPPRAKKMTAEELELAQRQMEAVFRTAQNDMEQEEAFIRDGYMKEYEVEVQLIGRELRQTMVATHHYEKKYKTVAAGANSVPLNFIFPVESKYVEPYANMVVDVEEVIRTALHRQTSPLGLQSIIAVDLEPLTPYSCGYACLASSTGNTIRVPYKPEQRRLLSGTLTKAFDGHAPRLNASSKYAVLTGGIETAENQRDWKSFASYVISKMKPACSNAQQFRELKSELERELPFSAELIPVRDLVVPPDVRDRRRRDRDGQKITTEVVIGVGSTKVQSDMFALFKNIFGDLPLAELNFQNTIHIMFSKHNHQIDAISLTAVATAVEKCRPMDCNITFRCRVTSHGVEVVFKLQGSNDKLGLTQWLGSIVVQSLSWQIPQSPLYGYGKLEVDYVEYVFFVKTTCTVRRFRQYQKQWNQNPVPEPYIRFLSHKAK